MEAVLALLLSCAFAYVCAPFLKAHPGPFYALFALVGAVFASGALGQALPAAELALIPFFRRASLAFGIFSVVMFVGVLPDSSALRSRLAPVRGQLSLLGAILIAVHVIGYAASYVASLASATLNPWILCGLVVGLVVVILLAILAFTSIGAVRKGMDAQRWKSVQKLAYPFYLLMYVHLAAMLVPSSMLGGNSVINLAVYTLVVLVYVVLRLSKARSSR